MNAEPTPFAIIEAPDRDKVLCWTGVRPLPLEVRLADGVWVESIAEVIYQLPKRDNHVERTAG